MPNPAWDDLNEFVDADDFAIPVVVTQAGVTWRFPGIFDDPYLDVQVGEYVMDSSEPRVTAPEAKMIGIRRGAVCVVDGRTWAVLDAPKPDGTGMSVLKLSKEP
jgi:hypothetical protein